MASLADVFTEKERTNWLKAWLAVDIAKSGLEQFAENEAKTVHINIYNNVLSSVPAPAVCNLCNTANLLQCPTQGICNKRGACTAMHDTAAKQPRPCPDNVCNKVLNEIEKQHKYANPSWKNTTATLWASTPWQIAKAYLPPDGYSGKSSIQDTDFNGIISFMMNCKHFNTKFSFPIAAGKNSPPCLLTKARDIGRDVRHSSQCKLTDAVLQDIFTTLINLLSDPTCLAQDVASQEAVKKLAKLQNDGVDTIAEKTLAEIRIHADKCKRELDEHTEKCKVALDPERDYAQSCEDFLGRLKEYYKKKLKMLPVSPIWYGREKSIMDIFVPIQFHHVAIEKDGSQRDTEQKVDTYKDMFYKNTTLSDRVTIQGDPGMGKTTFLAKLVLDWCNSCSKDPEPSSKFIDLETLQNFRFLFHIKLRDSVGQSKVVDMIKTQIIDEIYFNEKQQREAYDLLGNIMEREECLVTMDGLNEWTDHTKENPIPKLYSLSKQCVVLTTSRPWKMADKRIKDSEIGTLIKAIGIYDTEKLTQNMLRSLTEDDQVSYKEFMVYVEESNLNHFMASPWMLTLLVNLWVDKTFLSGSLCEINKVLIYTLFNKELPKEGLTEDIQSENDVFKHHTEICKALARMAFTYTLGSEKSLVFSRHKLLSTKLLSNEQLEFAIKAGVLNERHIFSAALCKSHISFIHETIQEFFAASHIANFSEDKITDVLSKSNDNLLEISQVIIYLSGLKCEVASKVINHLTEDLLNNVNEGLESLIIGSYDKITTLTFRETVVNTNTKLNSKIGINLSSDMRSLVISMLVQEMMISCYHEAKVSRQKHICLKMRDFTFHAYLNKNANDDLLDMLMMNKSSVRTLLLERNVLPENKILTCLQQSKHCIERLKTSVTRGIISALHNLNLKQLTLLGNKDVSLLSGLVPSLGNLTFLRIEESDFYGDMFPPSDIQHLCLLKSRCAVEFVVRLLLHLSQISHPVRCNLGEVYTTEKSDFYIAKLRPRIVSCDMSKVNLCLGEGSFETTGSKELFKILRDTSIGILDLRTADSASLASEILHTLNKLTKLYLWGTYTGRCDLKMPASLQCISLQRVECSSEWLCSLLITLSSLDHQVECELWNVVLKSNEEASGNESHSYILDLSSELPAHDMSNIKILVETGSKELFEILRDTSIGILDLRTADSASLASEILHTLNKLTKLYLWGTYTGRCDLKMPASLQCISLQRVECSSEWLCSLLITLSSLDHQVECELWNVVLKSNEEASGNESHSYILDLRSELLAHDMSNIEILVKTGSKELFEILRDTNIGILKLRTADCTSLASDILHTLNKLTQLYLWGTYTGRCDLKMPASLQCISLQSVECPSEWLCSLWITLSSLDHQVECELWDVVLKSNEEARGNESHSHLLDMRSELLAHDMSNIEILVKTGSKELFEILLDTSIGFLNLQTADSASLASEILHTLNKLTKLYLQGTYTGRCDLKMPASLQCISILSVECSSEWLCSLLITLSSLDHQVECWLWDVVLKSNEEASGNKSQSYLLDMRSELLAYDMSNMIIFVKTVSKELFEILRDTSIGILNLQTADSASLASEVLHTLNKLTKLYLRGTYTGRCDLKMPASLKFISLQRVECSSEWLSSLLITLSSLDHQVECELWDVVLKSNEEASGNESHSYLMDFRSELLSHDMSNMKILVETGSKELFEILRDTSIGILILKTTDSALFASDIFHTLNKLTKLCLKGTYTGRCDLKMPASLQCISLQSVECSSEWLCSLWITLSSLDHQVKCVLLNVVLKSNEEASGNESHSYLLDLRSELLAHDMSNIEILVKTGSKELFEILRYTSIGILNLQTADCASLASEILHTLNKLTKLYLKGTYTGRCDLKMPASLQCISLDDGECSPEWLCSLWITLSSLDHKVECELWNVVLKSNEEASGNESHSYLLDLRSELLAHDMSNIEILVKTGSKELFEILRDTSIGILILQTTDSALFASEILHTLNKLTKLYLCGTYTGRCDLKMPVSLQCICLVSVECSSEWLCSLWITLSSLDHQVECVLWDAVLKSNEEARGNESHSYLLDLRSELLAHDISNIKIYMETGSKELFEILRDKSIGILNLQTADSASLASEILPTLNKLTKLYLCGHYTGRCDLKMPASLQCISLQSVECSSEWLCSLWITLSSLDHKVECELWNVVLKSNEEASGNESHSYLLDLRSELLAHDMSNIEILVETGSQELFEILRDTSIGILNLKTADSASLASEILHTLYKQTKLYLCGTYTGRCDLKMPASLQCISLQSVECSSEWLCSLWITLSSLDHQVMCELWNVVLKSNEEASGNESHSYLLDLRSELLAHDMSNIEILAKTGSKKLFEILRYTSIGILDLRTADCASLASEILHTLNKLTKLYLRGTYTGRCDLMMPASLQCISLQSVECSSEWLYSLLITLSSLDHQVECELWGVVLESNEEARGNGSHSYLLDLRSELLALDMSNIEILVDTGSKELFEILRDTSIGILNLKTADSASLAFEILHTLNKLTKLYLWGTYTGRCDVKMPASLQCICLQSVECSSEWLCSLWITLSSLDHQVKCELWIVVLKSNEETRGNESHSYLLDLRSELLAHDMPNIEILVKNGSKELFEILRDTSIGILNLKTADSASLAFEILHTLNKLTKLYLWGTYTGRFDLKMPASLQCISLQSVECSSEWLCSLLITLSSLDHQVKCELWDVVLESNEEASGNESHSYLLDLRSELLAHDMSNIEILVKTGSKELFEIVRYTSIDILDLRTADSASLASEILHTLNKLTKLYLMGTFTGRCDFKLPASLQCIILQNGECSPEWLGSFFITLSELHHQVECAMFDFRVKTSDTGSGIEPGITVFRSELLSCDLSHVKLNVDNDSRIPFELVRGTNIDSLLLTSNDDASMDLVTQSSLTMLKEIRFKGINMGYFDHKLPSTLQFMILCDGYCSPDWLNSLMIHLSTLGHSVRLYLYKYAVVSSRESNAITLEPPSLKCEDLSNVKLELMKDSPGLYETLCTINITSLNMTEIEHPDMLSQTLPLLTHLQQLRMCLKQYTVMKLPGSIKYVFIIYTTFSPTSLQNFVQDMYTAKHNVDCKLLFRVERNEHEYMRIKQEVCKLDSVEVQQFEVVDKRHYCGAVAAAATLSATADEADDDFDKHLLRREGYIDSRTWLHYCKIRLHIS